MGESFYLPPRELEVMGILWRLGSGTVAEVRDGLADDLAYTTVLSILQVLTQKGFVRHEAEGRAYRYFPLVAAEEAGQSALERIRDTVFQGSAEQMMARFVADEGLSRDDLLALKRLLSARLRRDA